MLSLNTSELQDRRGGYNWMKLLTVSPWFISFKEKDTRFAHWHQSLWAIFLPPSLPSSLPHVADFKFSLVILGVLWGLRQSAGRTCMVYIEVGMSYRTLFGFQHQLSLLKTKTTQLRSQPTTAAFVNDAAVHKCSIYSSLSTPDQQVSVRYMKMIKYSVFGSKMLSLFNF